MSSLAQLPSAVSTRGPLNLQERTYVLVAVAFTALYFAFSFLSDGYFQDDEIDHFITAYNFWKDPSSILTYWSRPGFKLFHVVPALFGMKGVHLAASVIAGGAVYFASLLAREYGVQNRILTLLLCGFQPLFYQISFRTYAEILGALLIALMLIFYKRKQFVLTAVVSSYLFSVRHELVVLSIVLGVFFLWRREWLALIWLGWMPVLLNILGWLSTNDPFWVVNSYLAGGENIGFSKPGFFQYIEMATPIFGTTVVALLLVGLLGMFAESTRAWKKHAEKYHALYISLVAVLLMNSILASETFNISSGQGIWRHILTLSPVVAVFATIGFNIAWNTNARLRTGAVLLMGVYAVAVAVFFSYAHNHYRYITVPNYVGLLVLLGVAYMFLVAPVLAFRTRTLVLLTTVLVSMHTISVEKPLRLSPEGKTVQEVAALYEKNGFRNRVVLSNHPFFYYITRFRDYKLPEYPRITLSTIERLPPGAIVIWDTHYGHRPLWAWDAPLDSLLSDRTLKPLRSFLSSDKWFYVVVFEKRDTLTTGER